MGELLLLRLLVRAAVGPRVLEFVVLFVLRRASCCSMADIVCLSANISALEVAGVNAGEANEGDRLGCISAYRVSSISN